MGRVCVLVKVNAKHPLRVRPLHLLHRVAGVASVASVASVAGVASVANVADVTHLLATIASLRANIMGVAISLSVLAKGCSFLVKVIV